MIIMIILFRFREINIPNLNIIDLFEELLNKFLKPSDDTSNPCYQEPNNDDQQEEQGQNQTENQTQNQGNEEEEKQDYTQIRNNITNLIENNKI